MTVTKIYLIVMEFAVVKIQLMNAVFVEVQEFQVMTVTVMEIIWIVKEFVAVIVIMMNAVFAVDLEC